MDSNPIEKKPEANTSRVLVDQGKIDQEPCDNEQVSVRESMGNIEISDSDHIQINYPKVIGYKATERPMGGVEADMRKNFATVAEKEN